MYKKLRKWRFICFKAANIINTHHYIQTRIREFFYLDDKTIARLRNVKVDDDGILTTSKLNSTYQVLSSNFKGQLPMAILTCLNANITRHFYNEYRELEAGERTIRNYKRTIPMPFSPNYITHIEQSDDKVFYRFVLFGIKFRTYFGADLCGTRSLWEKAIRKEIKFCNSLLFIDEKTRKIFLNAHFEIEHKAKDLDYAKVAEAEMTIETPVSLRIGRKVYEIGNKEEFMFRRLAIQAALQRIQRSMKFDRPQHGIKRKLKKIESFQNLEKNYVRTKLHYYSRQIISLCVKHGTGTLVLSNHEVSEKLVNESPILLRNWSYCDFIKILRYKASEVGIHVVAE